MATVNIADELSIQLHSLRAYGDLDRQLAALAELGFRRVELVGGQVADARRTRALLDAHGLSAPTGHIGLDDLRRRFDWAADQAQAVGLEALFMPAVPPQDRDAPADRWRAIGAELGEMAERMHARGLDFGYHNHDWELRPFADGTTPLVHLFDGAAGSRLAFEADVAWMVRGGADPLAWMEREKARLAAVHVKDIAPEGGNAEEDGWADVGKGVLDWPAFWREARARGARWMVLEHDKPADPIRFARDSRRHLIETLG
jgi:sugar phosphate isomerase/epimerase